MNFACNRAYFTQTLLFPRQPYFLGFSYTLPKAKNQTSFTLFSSLLIHKTLSLPSTLLLHHSPLKSSIFASRKASKASISFIISSPSLGSRKVTRNSSLISHYFSFPFMQSGYSLTLSHPFISMHSSCGLGAKEALSILKIHQGRRMSCSQAPTPWIYSFGIFLTLLPPCMSIL